MGTLFGVPVQREWQDIETVENFLVTEWPETVVELGTGTGAFSTYLAAYCAAYGFRFHTYDTGQQTHPHQRPHDRCLDMVRKLGGMVERADVFAEWTVEAISRLLEGRSFIYCDNGDKCREFALYAPLLPVGSHIGVHDYGTEVQARDLDLSGLRAWREHLFAASHNRIFERIE